MQYYHYDTYGEKEGSKNPKSSSSTDANVQSAQTINTDKEENNWNNSVDARETGTFQKGSHA